MQHSLKKDFIKYLYKEMNVKKAAEAIGVSKATGYVYLKKWNSEGYDGLLPKYGGRPSKLTKNNKEELKNILKGKDSWTTKEIQKL
ncbi:helix-turn-helix domain-containing protein [Methanothermococcus sp. SCGC AD-155-C09]|nr:helix-turn-helix domain-containing protein [Methanothermococcus sp. SCGC AD-155-C09]